MYSERLEGKTLLLDDSVIPKTPSALLSGKKLNRGDETARAAARSQAEERAGKRKASELVGMRKARSRGGTAHKGDYIEYAYPDRTFLTSLTPSYTSLLPLHHLHVLYLASLMSLPPIPSPLPDPIPSLPPGISAEGITSKLLKADFTGIALRVISSRNASLSGISGIVIEETGATFRLVGEDGRVKVVPKEGTQFALSFPAYAPARAGENEPVDLERHLQSCPRIELNMLGTNFGYRSGDRAGRRFRLAQGEGGGNGWGEEWVRAEWDHVFVTEATGDGSGTAARVRTTSKRRNDGEKGLGGAGRRKKGKSRRKDPFAGGCREVMF